MFSSFYQQAGAVRNSQNSPIKPSGMGISAYRQNNRALLCVEILIFFYRNGQKCELRSPGFLHKQKTLHSLPAEALRSSDGLPTTLILS
jgi:hypothetical protein